MTDRGQFGASKPPGADTPSSALDCSAVELWLAEAAEKILPSSVAALLQAHVADCPACHEKLAQARIGREWLLALKQEPLEIPDSMVARILARTSLAHAAGTPGAPDVAAPVSDHSMLDFARRHRAMGESFPGGAAGVLRRSNAEQRADQHANQRLPASTGSGFVPADGFKGSAIPANSSVPGWQRSSVVVLRRTLFEPRLALVAAMAFFSISLTLNLMGVRLTSLRAANLAPQNLRRAVTRQYAEANASVVRYYENLRIVYEVEARVQQLRRAAEISTPPEQGAEPRKQSDSSGDSSDGHADSHRDRLAVNPTAHERVQGSRHAVRPALPDAKPVVTGPRMDAAFRLPQPLSGATERVRGRWMDGSTVHILPATSVSLAGTAPLSGTQFTFQPAPPASSCPLRNICLSRHYFSRERRLA